MIVKSIDAPVQFKKATKAREDIAIKRLKDIRTLEVAYKQTYGKYTNNADSLADFYKNGKLTIIKQIGSMDDSLAVAQKKIKREEILINVKDTLCKEHADFNIDSLKFIPFSNNDTVIMQALIKKVSGVDVPLFEAAMPYHSLLRGLDKQLIINLCAAKEDLNKYPGMMVGSVSNPNNNAGNWE